MIDTINDQAFAWNKFVKLFFIGCQYSGKCYQLRSFDFWQC